MIFNIVLLAPCIPQNTGNIGRLVVSNNSYLHLIKPLGFSLENKYLKRSGLDYWKNLKYNVYSSWNSFIDKNLPQSMVFLSTKATRSFYKIKFTEGIYLIFGNESDGLPSKFYSYYSNLLYKIPMYGNNFRSLNLANCVAIVLYEGLRQIYEEYP